MYIQCKRQKDRLTNKQTQTNQEHFCSSLLKLVSLQCNMTNSIAINISARMAVNVESQTTGNTNFHFLRIGY